jgi:predicted dehydrogenase
MTDTQIGVGIIGVEPGRSWSAVAHIPALRSLPQFKFVALSTRRQESVDAAARAYGSSTPSTVIRLASPVNLYCFQLKRK